MIKAMNKIITSKAQATLDGLTPAARAAAERLAVLNHCSPAEMLVKIQTSVKKVEARPQVLPDIGVSPATEDEVLAAARRVAERTGETPDEVLARVRDDMRRVSRRGKWSNWNPLTGKYEVTTTERRRTDERLTNAHGITAKQLRERARAATHTSNAILAGDRRRVSRFVRQVLDNISAGESANEQPSLAGRVLALAAQGSSRAEITSALLREGVRL